MSKEIEVATLQSVTYDTDTTDVDVKFKVLDPEYRDFVLRWANREDGRLVIRGESLFVSEKKGQMRTSNKS